jgi:hypothetical protein
MTPDRPFLAFIFTADVVIDAPLSDTTLISPAFDIAATGG